MKFFALHAVFNVLTINYLSAVTKAENRCPKLLRPCTCFQTVVKCHGLTEFPPISLFPANTTSVIVSSSPSADIRVEEFYKLTQLASLTLTYNKISNISSFGASKLQILILEHNEIIHIEPRAFDGLAELLDLSLKHNRLDSFPLFGKTSKLEKLFLDGNPDIKTLSKSSLWNLPSLQILSLEATGLMDIPHGIFKRNTALRELNLTDTVSLTSINENAFEGATALTTLNLRNTRIRSLPSQWLENLEVLDLRDVPEFWSLPPTSLWNIEEIKLNQYNAFLCCAFYLATGKPDCATLSGQVGTVTEPVSTTGPSTNQMTTLGTPSTKPTGGFGTPPTRSTGGFGTPPTRPTGGFGTPPTPPNGTVGTPPPFPGKPQGRGFGTPPPGSSTPRGTPPGTPSGSSSNASTTPLPVHTLPTGFQTNTVIVSSFIPHGNRTNASVYRCPTERPPVKCSPPPDALHPCEDIMGATWLTAVSFIVGGVALVANFIVATVLLTSERHLNVTRFLMCNLSFADFCLGLYLFILTCVSIDTHGVYYNFVRSWQQGAGCKILGFFAVFSTELSVYTLTLITLERFYAIVYAMQMNTRLSMRATVRAMAGGWVLSILLATLPYMGASSYGEVAICLPFDVSSPGAVAYIAFLLLLNGVAFAFVLYLYAKMLLTVMRGGGMEGAPQRNDSKVAKRMAVLVFTDFFCWAPIAFFGVLAAFGVPLIDVTASKTLLVFFFPINSLCNPFLYAFFTKAFLREFFTLLSRCGVCKKRALKYQGTLSSFMYSRRKASSTLSERSKRVSSVSNDYRHSRGDSTTGSPGRTARLNSGIILNNVTGNKSPPDGLVIVNNMAMQDKQSNIIDSNENSSQTKQKQSNGAGMTNPAFTNDTPSVKYVTGDDQVFFPPSPTADNKEAPKSVLKKTPTIDNEDIEEVRSCENDKEDAQTTTSPGKLKKKVSVVFKE